MVKIDPKQLEEYNKILTEFKPKPKQHYEYPAVVEPTEDDLTEPIKTVANLSPAISDARDKIYGLLQPKPSVINPIFFEELKEVGLNPPARELNAIFEIKQPYGYGGGPGSLGSHEYVGFYVDWSINGNFIDTGEFIGISGIRVWDPGEKTPLPLSYAIQIRLVIPSFASMPGTYRVRAILSWEVPPIGPNFKPKWGNMIERFIRLDPLLT